MTLHSSDSSSVHHQDSSIVYCLAAWSGWNWRSILITLASSQH